MKRFLACIALFLFGLMPTVVFAQGLGPDAFMVNPYDEAGATRSWVLYAAKPGAVIEETIQITNKSDQAIEFSVLGVDATLTSDKGFALRNDEDQKLYVGKWMESSASTVTVQPRENVLVPFTIRVPSDVKEGDYWGAIVARQLTAMNLDTTTGYATGWRVGIRTMIQVDSRVESFERLPQVNEGGSYNFVQALTPRVEEYAALPPVSPEVSTASGVDASSKKSLQPKSLQADVTGSSSSLFLVGIVVIVGLLLVAVLFGKKKSKLPPVSMIFLLLFFGDFSSFFLNIPSLSAAEGGLSILPYALDESGVEISQSWFVLRLAPGETKQYQVKVTNTSDATVPIWVYPVDATVTSDGGFALQSESYEDTDVGSWIVVSEPEFELPGLGTKIVDFTISIPANAEVGDHAGGIIVQPSAKASALEATGFNIVSRSGVRVYVHVPGETVTKLDVGGLSFSLLSDDNSTVVKRGFIVSLANIGNVRLVPVIEVTIKNWYGKVVDTFTHSISEIPPGQSATIKIPWDKLVPGKYTAYLVMKYGGEGNVSEQSVGFIVYPEKEVMVKWGVIAFGFIIFLVILKLILSKFHISFSVGRDKK